MEDTNDTPGRGEKPGHFSSLPNLFSLVQTVYLAALVPSPLWGLPLPLWPQLSLSSPAMVLIPTEAPGVY